MKKNFNGIKGMVTVEACIAFPIFLCFLLTLIFFIRLACMDMALEHTANETAKQLAVAAYPMKFINELEDESFLDKPTYVTPSFAEEIKNAKNNIFNEIDEGADIFSLMITGEENNSNSLPELFDSISNNALSGLKTGFRAYITDKFGSNYYEIKNKIKYSAVRILSEKYIEGSYIDKNKLEYALVQMPQSTVEYNIRAKDAAYMKACTAVGYIPGKDDVVVALRYKVKVPIPFFNDRAVILEHIGVERAWLNGSNGVYSQDHNYEISSSNEDSESNDTSLEENYRRQQDETVYVTNTGTKYHRNDCPCLSSSKRPIKLSEAKDRGYKICGVCSNKGKWNFYR